MTAKKNKIGFNYTGSEEITTAQETAQETAPAPAPMPIPAKNMSNAHMNLILKIQGFKGMILEPTFKNLTSEQQASYLETLIDVVSLESELSVKNAVIWGK